MTKIFLFLILTLNILYSEEIEVSLSTKQSLKPAYLSKVFDEGSSFDISYHEEIKDILHFDLHQNGYLFVEKQDYEKDFKISHFDRDVAFDAKYWKDKKTAYIIKAEIKQKKLKIYTFTVDRENLKIFSDIDLSGDLNIDRKKIHKLCDSIQELFSGQKGIADLKILYTVRNSVKNKNKQQFTSEIWTCDYDGGNKKQLTFDNSYYVHPIFIPEKNSRPQKYIYVSYIDGQPKLFKTSLEDPKSTKLVSLRGNQLLPSISLKGDMVAFISDAAGRPDLFLQKLDNTLSSYGKPMQLFSVPRATNASPTFSPDGKKIAFVSDKDGPPRIYVIKIPDNIYNRKRPIAQLITRKNRHNVTPSWSYDGTKLAYSAKTDGIRQIWIYDFETDEEWQLTKGRNNKENPYWATDNLHIIYNTEDKTSSELYLININQKKATRITDGKGQNRFPAFEPRL